MISVMPNKAVFQPGVGLLMIMTHSRTIGYWAYLVGRSSDDHILVRL